MRICTVFVQSAVKSVLPAETVHGGLPIGLTRPQYRITKAFVMDAVGEILGFQRHTAAFLIGGAALGIRAACQIVASVDLS